jgi:hypothetical protein
VIRYAFLLTTLALNFFPQPLVAAPDIAAEFETSYSSEADATQSRRWRLFRDQHSVETSELGSPDGEEWILNADQSVTYRRLFHPERRAVEYSPRDLALSKTPAEWSRIAHVVSPKLLEKLKPTDQPSKPDALRYEGEVDGQSITVVWSKTLELPERVETKGPSGHTKVVLVQHHRLSDSPWMRLGKRDYHTIEFTDLGDSEQDPIIKRILQRMGKIHQCGSLCATGGHLQQKKAAKPATVPSQPINEGPSRQR